MGVLRDLESSLIDHRVPVSTTMRRAKVLAVRLGADQLERWVDTELNGYRGESELPPYRRVAAQTIATFSGPLGTMLRNIPAPTAHLKPEVHAYATTHNFTQGVRELESLISDTGDWLLRAPWPPDLLRLLGENVFEGYNCVEAWKPIGRGNVEQVLETIRNRLLNFVLELEKLYPEADDDERPAIRADQANQVFNLHIYGNSNVVAAGSKVLQSVQQQIASGDVEGLTRALRGAGVSEGDLQDLTKAIKEDGTVATAGSFGKRVSNWIGRMTEKAAAGAWKVALDVAPSLITKALSAYYGWK
jgi:hypothetical protein